MKYFFLAFAAVFSLVFFSTTFAQTSSRDALGVRVFKNPLGLSAADWYRDQCKGQEKAFAKCGTPTPIVVDGYDGIRDGNTVYVNAANKGSDGKLYTNIYLLAVAEGASEGGSAVFDQILQNWRFPTAIPPLSIDDAAKLRRDVRRHSQIVSMRRLLDSYKETKRCSFTRTQLCSDTTQCSQGQTCGNYLPTIASGTYIPKVSFSTWPSWQETLGQTLGGTLPTDSGRPYLLPDPKDSTKQTWQWKHFIGCGNPYNPETCWDAKNATMACPLQAYAFAYRYNEQDDTYSLTTTYESSNFPESWRGEIHDPRSWTGTLCTALVGDTPDADRDFDGVPDRVDNCPADYNTDQRDSDRDGKGDSCDSCPRDDRNDIDRDGICGNVDTCPFAKNTGRDIDGDGIDDACDSVFCGNSRIDAGEQCDTTGGQGLSVTDQYACGAPDSGNDCKWVGGWCGDWQVNGTEQCDGRGGQGSSVTDQYECGAQTPRTAKSCRFIGGWCGDGIRNGAYEPCDVNDGTRAGLQDHQVCIKTDAGACVVKLLTHCGDSAVQNPNEEKVSEQCEDAQQSARACVTTDGYRGDQSRTCVASSCQWGPFGACNPAESCGDGIRNGAEVCDKQADTPVNAACRADCAAWTCDAGYRPNNNACELDHCEGATSQACVIANGAGSQTRSCNTAAHPPAWSAWGACTAVSCNSGYRVYNNACERDGCDGPATQNCAIANGQGTQSRTCNTALHPPAYSDWNACIVSSCNAGFHVEANACVSNTRSCIVVNGQGTETWDQSWGPCTVTSASCNAGFHAEANACVSNTRPCIVANGQGTETWNGSAWGACTAVSCNSGYRVYNNACERDGCDGPATQNCAIANGQGTQSRTCNTALHPPAYSDWNACIVSSCNAGFQKDQNTCAPLYRCVPGNTCASVGTGFGCGETCTVSESRENSPSSTPCAGGKSWPYVGKNRHGWFSWCGSAYDVGCSCPAQTY